jgi:N-methylhydantoinase A
VCTEGFRDVIYFRDGFKPDRFNVRLRHPQALVDPWLCVGVRERLNSAGQVVTPLDEGSVLEAAEHFAQAGVEAIAVALLWAPVNPDHERRVAALLRRQLPEVPVIEAAEVLPEIREWERTSAAVLSAYLLPEMMRYLRRLEHELRESGFRGSVLLMQTNGGCASVSEILRRPVYSLASGPAAAPAAAIHVSGPSLRNILVMDLGGTSFDVSLITDGQPRLSRTIQIEGQPIGVPGVAVHSVGAGGGSIASVDGGGVVHVGPLSAGAHPGPACYGHGGKRATVTDAYVVLGYLAPNAFFGGRRVLHDDLAIEALDRDIAKPLGIDPVVAADGVRQVVEAHMVRAIQAMSIKRGIDPRRYTVVGGGGAGGVHAAQVARRLGIDRILVPAEAPVLCSLGMTVADVQHDYARLLPTSAEAADLNRIDGVFQELERDARDRLRQEGFGDESIHLDRCVDIRYRGQIYDLTVPLAGDHPLRAETLGAAGEEFHRQHKLLYGYERPDLPLELLHWRLTARGLIAAAPRDIPNCRQDPVPAAPREQRLVYFSSAGGWILVGVYTAQDLQAGMHVLGPAVIQAPATTVVLHASDRALVRSDGSYMLLVGAERDTLPLSVGRDLSSR